MGDNSFSWKGLFIQEDESSEESVVNVTNNNSNTTFPKEVLNGKQVDDRVLNDILKMYEAGFESLNTPGYDFFEFFKAVKAVGSNDPQVYKMALTMAKGVDNSVSKQSLLSQANFYIDEINKVYKQYAQKGKEKKLEEENLQKSKKQSLELEIAALEKTLLEAQTKISEKRNALEAIKNNRGESLLEIEQKIIANDHAKSTILNSIQTIVQGIEKNI